MRPLIIAEKPELGRAITAAIDGSGKEVRGVICRQNVIITWAYGHLLRLCEPGEYDGKYKKQKKKDLPICFENWKLVPDGSKKDRVEQIMVLMQECDQTIHAGDPGDEGQFLIDEILDYVQNEKPVERVYINDNTPANIKKAFHDLINNDEKLRAAGRSAYARAAADYVVGINYSRLFSLLLRRKGMSVGRVQSPTLKLIVMHDEAIDHHVKQKYYELYTGRHITEPDTSTRFQPKPKSDLLDDGKHILHRNIMEGMERNIMAKPDQKVKVDEKFMDVKPPLPFGLAKLQAHMNARYSFDLNKTDQITQTLRDRYQAITYNRSDSQYLKEEHFQEADKVLPHVMSKLDEQYPVDYELHSEYFNDKYVTAHHAIIPTISDFSIAQLLPDERKVYEGICRYYIVQFLPPIRKRQLNAIIKTEYGDLRATSTCVLDEGYKKYFALEKGDSQEEEEDDNRFGLPKSTYPIQLVSSELQEKETNPPKRHAQASLIRDMVSIAKYVQGKEAKDILKKKDKDKKGENGSIGASATRSQIMETLIKRRYVEMKRKNIISTQLGKDFYHLLSEEIKKPDLTAKWWVIQEDIKGGNADVKTLVDSVLEAFVPHLRKDYSHLRISGEVEIDDGRKAIGICPVCRGKIVENGRGFGCVNYHDGYKLALWKEDYFFQSIEKKVTLPMTEKLLKDKYYLVKLKEGEQEIIKVLQLGVRNGRAVYCLVDVPKKDTSAKRSDTEAAPHTKQKKT